MKKTMIFLTVLCAFTANAQWSLTGNAGTNPGTSWNNGVNFLGTTDSKDLVFKTNNFERVRINSAGKIGLGIGYIDPYYSITYTGSNKFLVYEDISSFLIYNEDKGYKQFRVDGEHDVIFLQEDYGKVIIGSTALANCASCTGYKLFVKDGIKTEKVKVEIASENGWADYVFNKDYKLMPLKELGNYIAENNHLPEVPTTEEAITNGIELKEMNILLLKKIEELTLHIIAQDKRIENLEKTKN